MTADEEKDKGRYEGESSDNTNVFDFELAQRQSIKMIEDNQVCIQGHCECPEHVGYWKPIFLGLECLCEPNCLDKSLSIPHTFAARSLGIDIATKYPQL